MTNTIIYLQTRQGGWGRGLFLDQYGHGWSCHDLIVEQYVSERITLCQDLRDQTR